MTDTQVSYANNTDVNGKSPGTKEFVTMVIDGQLFGIPVLAVQDVLNPHSITPIPLSNPEILGSINLRGRIVTVINMRKRLGAIEDFEEHNNYMHVVVDYKHEQYSLMVDKVGEVLKLPLGKFEQNPANLPAQWQEVALGVYRLEKQIMVVLDIENLLKF